VHETAFAAGILRIVREEARRHNVSRITEIHLQVGRLSAVEEQGLRACFELLAEGGVAQGAILKTANAPLPARCANCGQSFELVTRSFCCPRCRSADIRFQGGHGCTIQSISAERADQESPDESDALSCRSHTR
jgi:hydrogenase nickel incorporation protein HypA/HybF